jgi:hypothetical protein
MRKVMSFIDARTEHKEEAYREEPKDGKSILDASKIYLKELHVFTNEDVDSEWYVDIPEPTLSDYITQFADASGYHDIIHLANVENAIRLLIASSRKDEDLLRIFGEKLVKI